MRKTTVRIPEQSVIEYNSTVLFIGSCFSEHLSKKMIQSGFSVQENPFGVVFNPISLAHFFRMSNQEISDSVFLREDVALAWHANSNCFAYSKDELKSNLIQRRKAFFSSIPKAKVLFMTFGTAWVYAEKSTNKIVGNCHKMPQNSFMKRLLSTDEIVETWKEVITELHQMNNELQLVFTVSPVRHIKEGAVKNSRSKAILLEAVHQLKSQFQHVDYFPAYELMMDEMRDYAYYTADGIHPNKIAVNEIWKRFKATYFTPETKEIHTKFSTIQHLFDHRSLHPDSAASKQFRKDRDVKREAFQERYPMVNCNF